MVNLLDNSLLVWVVIAVVGLFVLRFILKVTKKILTLGIMICLAVAAYLFITQYLFPGAPGLP
jgi:threonine/homoserine efflux transporter RhtA